MSVRTGQQDPSEHTSSGLRPFGWLADCRPDPVWSVRWDLLFIGLIMLFNVLAVLNSSTMADLNRDLISALRIVDGEWLTAGPAIAQRMHNGPVWFYILSLPLWISHSWWLISLWSGVLIASVWPLAYGLGRLLHGRKLGLAFVAALALPSWFSVYDYVYSHPALIPSTTVATLLATVYWWRQPGSWRLFLAALLAALATHAHFSTFGLTLFLTGLVIRVGWCDGFKLSQLAALIIGTILPWAPYLLEQGAQGFTEIASALNYAGGFQLWANLRDLPATLVGHFVKGPWFALHFLTGWPMLVSVAIAVSMALLVGLGTGPWLRLWKDRKGGYFACLILLGMVFVATMLIREFTPFYQTLSLQVIVSGMLAMGWLIWLDKRAWLLPVLMALALLVQLGEWHATERKVEEGVVFAPWSSLAILEQRQWGDMETRWWLAPADRDQAAQLICESGVGEILLLGHLGAAIGVDGGVSIQMHCEEPLPALWFQLDSGNPLLVAGISRAAAAALQLEEELSIGGFHPLPSVRYQSLPAKAVPLAAEYPPDFELTGAGTLREFPLEAGEILALVNPLQSFITFTAPSVSWQGQRLEPVYSDAESYFYECEFCSVDQPVAIEIAPSVSDWIQVFAFPAAGSTSQTAVP